MSQRTELKACRISGMEREREAIAVSILARQVKHKTVADMQMRMKEVTHEILKMELENG